MPIFKTHTTLVVCIYASFLSITAGHEQSKPYYDAQDETERLINPVALRDERLAAKQLKEQQTASEAAKSAWDNSLDGAVINGQLETVQEILRTKEICLGKLNSALWYAVHSQNPEIIRVLLNAQADPHAQSIPGARTALAMAIRRNYTEIVELLNGHIQTS